MTAQADRLTCPNPTCGSADLVVLEQVIIRSYLSDHGILRYADGTLDYDIVDSKTGDSEGSIGVECNRCHWTHEGLDWPGQLRSGRTGQIPAAERTRNG